MLDTWFSSALWPFSTLGWPDETPTLETYYPTDTLVTDRGIIYFWVARMVMMGLKMRGKVPFSDVYIHGTILDETGRKMSKSLGNGIDPLEVIQKYGADAMRFSLMVLSTEGQDLKLSESKFEMGRNFCNKLWNASRFAMMNLEGTSINKPADNELNPVDKWITNLLQETIRDTRASLDNFQFSFAAQTLYEFVWNDFCDWYLEAIKLHIKGNDTSRRNASLYTLKEVLSNILKLLHPFLPFITEEIWHHLNPDSKTLIISKYPRTVENIQYYIERHYFDVTVKEPVEAIRNIRGESKINPSKKIPHVYSEFRSEDKATKEWLSGELDYVTYFHSELYVSYLVQHLANVDNYKVIRKESQRPRGMCATNVTQHQITYIPLEDLIDIDSERSRLKKEIGKVENEIIATKKKLANKGFTDRAPPEIVERERTKATDAKERVKKLKGALKALD